MIAPSLGQRPQRMRKIAPVESAKRLTTLVMATRPTFWLKEVLGSTPKSAAKEETAEKKTETKKDETKKTQEKETEAVLDPSDGKQEADLITLEVLPNEGAVVGDIYDTDDTSFCGCLNQCLRFLQENTRAQIVLIVMVGSNNTLPEQIIEKRGNTQFEFAQKAEQVGRLNSVPVINIFCEGGFGYARVKSRKYQNDNIHLNELGGLNMGRFVWSKLKDIPLWDVELPDSQEKNK